MHGKMIVNYNTAFDNSNLCALNYVQYLNITDNIDLIENAVLFKNFTLFEYMFFSQGSFLRWKTMYIVL